MRGLPGGAARRTHEAQELDDPAPRWRVRDGSCRGRFRGTESSTGTSRRRAGSRWPGSGRRTWRRTWRGRCGRRRGAGALHARGYEPGWHAHPRRTHGDVGALVRRRGQRARGLGHDRAAADAAHGALPGAAGAGSRRGRRRRSRRGGLRDRDSHPVSGSARSRDGGPSRQGLREAGQAAEASDLWRRQRIARKGVRALLDRAAGRDDQGDRREARHLVGDDQLQPGGLQHGKPEAVRRHPARQHDGLLPRSAGRQGGD